MTYDGSNRKDVRSMEKEAKLSEQNRLAYTRRIMGDAAGRKWIHDILFRCHIWNTAFVAGSPDTTAFRLGEQNIGLQIFADVVTAAPDEYVQMMTEAAVKEAVHERRYSDERPAGSEHSGSEDIGRNTDRPEVDYDPYAVEPDPDGRYN